MLRSEVLQPFIDRAKNGKYLEIGVEGGITFHDLNAAKKVAVDPIFRFDVPADRITERVEYHEVTSDDYFGSIASSMKFDVIYIDGLHTVEQTLRDLLNAVEHLSPDGVIVIDDVVPSSFAASLFHQSDAAFVRDRFPTERYDGESWMGPIYRLVYFIANFMQSYNYATIQDNHGQLVMWRKIRSSPLNKDATLESVIRMEFIDMLHNMDAFRMLPYRDIFRLVETEAGGRQSDL